MIRRLRSNGPMSRSCYRCSPARTAERWRSCRHSRRSSSEMGGPACGPAPGENHAASQTSRRGSARTWPQARQPTESWLRRIEREPHRGQIIATTPYRTETSVLPPRDDDRAGYGFGVGCAAGLPNRRRSSFRSESMSSASSLRRRERTPFRRRRTQVPVGVAESSCPGAHHRKMVLPMSRPRAMNGGHEHDAPPGQPDRPDRLATGYVRLSRREGAPLRLPAHG